MVSLKSVGTLFEKLGFLNLHNWQDARRESLQNLYANFAFFFFLCHSLCHLFSSVTRATSYLPEFFQTFLEDCTIFPFLATVYYFRSNHRNLNEMIDLMENSFSKADKEIVERTHSKSKWTVVAFVSAVFFAVSSSFIETIIPITDSELEIRTNVYRTAHPERRLPYPLRIPFIDETVSPNYELLYLVDFVIMFYFINWAGLACSIPSIIAIHVRGQYEIIGKFIAKIGHDHRDRDGNRVFYTNIETNEYFVKMYPTLEGKGKLVQVTQRLREQREYEKRYVGQIVRFHMKLVTFREKWISILGPIVLGIIIANNITISLCLYQTVVSPDGLSAYRWFKFAAEFLTLLMEYFIVCNSSEAFDDGHNILLRAFNQSHWEAVTRQTKRDLCMILRRVQKPNHLRFYNGAVVICAPYFLKVLQVAYTFVNFMRLRMTLGRIPD